VARIVCFGELMIRFSPPGRELLLQTPTLHTSVAGAEGNAAVALARFGHDVRMVSFVGDNALGAAAITELRKHGVDTRYVKRAPGRMGVYFVTAGAGQRPGDVLYDRVNSAFALAPPDAVDWPAVLDGADWLHISGVTPAVSRDAGEAALNAMKAAREAGVKVSFDANFRSKLWEVRGDDPREALTPLFENADLIFAEARDISLLTGKRIASHSEATELAFKLFPNVSRIAHTTRTVINADHHELVGHMCGRKGGASSRKHAVTGIVDRIGGGDAFASGFLHGLISGMDETTALDFAVGAAVLKHAIPGDFNLITEADVRYYLTDGSSDVRR
jgi:2-dehydro-3-deoxygluconokinase